MQDRESAELKRRVARLGPRGAGARFPPALRDRITAWVRRRRDGGAWWCDLSREVGVPAATLSRWASPRAHHGAPARLVPVEVIDVPTTRTVTLVAPTGLRVEGVAIADAIAILRGLA